jgi:hypothetical protein
MISSRLSRLPDVLSLAHRLRQADQEEIRAASGGTPLQALRQGFYDSTYPQTVVDAADFPLAMFGAVPANAKTAYVWMLASDDLLKYRFEFLRNCRREVDALHFTRPHLSNVVDSRNTLHIKWLLWCGFTITSQVPVGPYNMPFYFFEKYKECASL